jgi:glycosyltransferase involved in cell wall biosynthesis
MSVMKTSRLRRVADIGDGNSTVAYLLDQYPAISHSFILREVQVLRELDVDVKTFSIHRSDPTHLLAAQDREEFDATIALRPLKPGSLLLSHVKAFSRRPRTYVRTLREAIQLGRNSPRDVLWQLFYFAEAVPIWQLIAQHGARHVHAHFTSPAADVASIVASLGDRDGPWSWSFSAHGADIQETDQIRLAHKVRDASRVVCVSDFGRSQLMTLVGPEAWRKITVVHCGVDPKAFAKPGPVAHNGSQLHILNVGRLVPLKGQLILIEAVAALVDRGLDVLLTIVGDGPLRNELDLAVRQRALGDRVRLVGNVGQDDIVERYRDADVFCLPSFREGVPVALMEAMASGLPVIASGIMGIPELVQDRVSGLLVLPGRADLLATAIAALAGDPPLRRRLADNARAKIVAEYELRQCTRELLAVIRELAES